MHPGTSLRRLIDARQFFIAPGVFDVMSARVTERCGFPALYLTGYGVALSRLGQPDAGIAGYADFVDLVARIADRTKTPLIADADTGFGGLVNVRETVRGYERAGAAAIQIEDQDFPKRCGHTDGKRIIPAEEMALKIRMAADSRRDSDFLIIARTDSCAVAGLDEALWRAEQYAEAGADILFVEAPRDRDELARIGSAFDTPVMANMIPPPSKTPELGPDELSALGFAFAIQPGLPMMAAVHAMTEALGHLTQHGTSEGYRDRLTQLPDLHKLAGFPEIDEIEARYSLDGTK